MTIPGNLSQPGCKKSIPWIRVSANAPYFEKDNGHSWTPIGQNDAILWPDFCGLFRRKDYNQVEGHLQFLKAHGVTCIRMMMEYCQTDNRYLEKPAGRYNVNMVRFWDDLIILCEKYDIRLLITPFDTFWMSRRWKFHPYNHALGGPCKNKKQWMTSPAMLSCIKDRFTFFIERWGASGAIFGWDLWNEITPVHAENKFENLYAYIDEISTHIRKLEMRLFRQSHLQTISVFAPLLESEDMRKLVFQHPLLDFGSTHFYQNPSIDKPRNVLDAAVTVGGMVRDALRQTPPFRPFLDSEHGPISYFKLRRKALPEAFDDLYFLHMQWAHMASGAAGGGMRWPYRHPHTLTHGMRKAQLNMSGFSKIIDWTYFQRSNISDHIHASGAPVHVFACGDHSQAIVFLLVKEVSAQSKKSSISHPTVQIAIPGLSDGNYCIYFWDTVHGLLKKEFKSKQVFPLEFDCVSSTTNLAIAVRREY